MRTKDETRRGGDASLSLCFSVLILLLLVALEVTVFPFLLSFSSFFFYFFFFLLRLSIALFFLSFIPFFQLGRGCSMSLLLIYYFSFFSLLPSFISRFRSFLEFEFPGIYQDKCMHGRRERERGRDSLKRFLYFFEACIRALALNVPINDHPVFFFSFSNFCRNISLPG